MGSGIVSGLPPWDIFGVHPEILAIHKPANIVITHYVLSVSIEWE